MTVHDCGTPAADSFVERTQAKNKEKKKEKREKWSIVILG